MENEKLSFIESLNWQSPFVFLMSIDDQKKIKNGRFTEKRPEINRKNREIQREVESFEIRAESGFFTK